MNKLKSEVKIATAQEIGVKMDDLLDNAQGDIHRLVGAQAALQEASKNLVLLQAHVDKDIDGGLYDLEVGAKIKQYLTRAINSMENLSKHYENRQVMAEGRADGYRRAVQHVKSYQDAEKTKLASLEAEPEEGTSTPEEDTSEEGHPGPTIKELRQAEDNA